MALKLNLDGFNTMGQPPKNIRRAEPEPKEEEVSKEEAAPVETEEASNEDFEIASDFDIDLNKEEPKEEPKVEKKELEGHNREVFSAQPTFTATQETKKEPNLDNPDDLNIDLSLSADLKVDKEEIDKQFIERAGKKVDNALDREINREKMAIGVPSAPIPSKQATKVLCIGGDEQYYRTALSKLNQVYDDINFIKYAATAGKPTFYLIDTLNPDIILIWYKAQVQTALQFWNSVQNDVDDNGVPYRDKYRNRRVVVIAPNDLNKEMEMRNADLKYFVKEKNPRTHAVDLEELVEVIREAKRDIDEKYDDGMSTPQAEKQTMVEEPIQEQPAPQAVEERPVPVNPNERMFRQAQAPVAPRFMPQTTEAPAPSKIICVYSATGGAGKTTFATNLSAILAKYSNQDGASNYRVALVAYNLACQSIDLFFNIKSDKNVGTLAQESSAYSSSDNGEVKISTEQMRSLVSQYMYNDPRTGLDILLGITVPLEFDRIDKGFTTCLFQALKTMYDVVIVDMSTDIAKTPVLEALNASDEIYYIMPMDVPSIRNTRVLIRFFTGLFKFTPDQIKVILNKVNLDNEEFGVDQVYQAMASDECPPSGTIPYIEKDVLSSINRGVPIALEDFGNPVSQAIYSIAAIINPMIESPATDSSQKEEEKTGFMGKLFGGKKKQKTTEKPQKPAKTTKHIGFYKKTEEAPAMEEVEEEKPKKRSLFASKHKAEKSEVEKPKKRGLSIKTPKEASPQNDVGEEPMEEKPKKQGFFAKLFGGGKKKKQPKVVNKKKPLFGGLLEKGKGKSEPVEEEPKAPVRASRTAGSGRLHSIRPRRRE